MRPAFTCHRTSAPTSEPPAAITAVRGHTARRDAEYFQQHPDVRSYVRPYYEGECWPAAPLYVFDRVRVERLGAGGLFKVYLYPGQAGSLS